MYGVSSVSDHDKCTLTNSKMNSGFDRVQSPTLRDSILSCEWLIHIRMHVSKTFNQQQSTHQEISKVNIVFDNKNVQLVLRHLGKNLLAS